MRRNKTLLGVSIHKGSRILHRDFSTTTRQILSALEQHGLYQGSSDKLETDPEASVVRYRNNFAPVKKLTGAETAPIGRILGVIAPVVGLYNTETALVAGMCCTRIPAGRQVNAAMPPMRSEKGDDYILSFLRTKGACLVYKTIAVPDREFGKEELFLFREPTDGTKLILLN